MKKINNQKQETKVSGIKLVIIGIILIGMLVGFYFYVSYKMETGSKEDQALITKMQQILLLDLDKNYPPSPKELIKYYSEITQCFYNEDHTDEEIEALALQIQKLYDIELIANQTYDKYLTDLKTEISSMKKDKYSISSFAPSASTDVEYYTQDGSEWAKLYCTYSIRKGSKLLNTEEQFLLRKDEEGHWKIFGWKLAE